VRHKKRQREEAENRQANVKTPMGKISSGGGEGTAGFIMTRKPDRNNLREDTHPERGGRTYNGEY